MLRLALTLLILVALNVFPAVTHAQMPDDMPPPADCAVVTRTYNSRDISCAVVPDSARRTFVFKANFSGGHDDTQASITPVLDGQPLSCDAGSKLSLFGEDGDVSVWCAFQAPDQKASGTLKVRIFWSHADYANFEFGRR